MGKPEFIIFTGPMFGGKTTRLLGEAERYRYQKKKIFAYKPIIDGRYDDDYIVTHNGFKLKANRITSAYEIDLYLDKDWRANSIGGSFPIIVVDEAFMIKDSGSVLPSLWRVGCTILVSTLQLSASCKPFDEITKMMPWATRIEICPAVCTTCGSDAYYTHRKVDGLKEIEVGGSDLYEPRCNEHHKFFNIKI